MDPRVETGRQLGGYEVLASIARGGMGEIVVARSPASHGDHPLVALKILDEAEALRDSSVAMFMDEAQIMAQLIHPNVLRILDFGKDEGGYYMAMEYLQGQPLAKIIVAAHEKQRGVAGGLLARLGHGAATGLHAAHVAHGKDGAPLRIVHRDVSPGNIFVTYEGRVKVIDFGIARAQRRFTRTAAGVFKGKAAYMSPEQVQERPIDGKSDVFSLGVCLWEMATGRRLFARRDQFATMKAVVMDRIPTPSEVFDRKDGPLDAAIMSALEREPHDRPTAHELAEHLGAIAAETTERDVSNLVQGLFPTELAKDRALLHQLRSSIGQTDLYATAPVPRQEKISQAVQALGSSLAPVEERQRREREVLTGVHEVRRRVLNVVVIAGVILAAGALVLFFLR